MKDIYPKVVELFEKNRFSVLVTVIGQSGTTPRGVGSKLLVPEEGSCVGSIGGGLLEKSVLEEAEKVFASRLPVCFSYRSEEDDVGEPDMQCGGNVDLFLEPVSPDNLNHLYIFKEIIDIIRRGGSGVLATIIDPEYWYPGHIPKMFCKPDGEKIGSLLGIKEVEDAIIDISGQLPEENTPTTIVCRDEEGNRLNVFVESVTSDPKLYLFGGGHVSSHVAPLAQRVGFKVVVIDDRPEFADPEKFPKAEDVHYCSFDSVMERLPVDGSSYVVIMTRAHSHDKTVLAQALESPAGYIGMIGSRRKISIIFGKLLEQGFTQEQLERVHSPIGIDIGAETPEEIAVSIIAELIKVRAGA